MNFYQPKGLVKGDPKIRAADPARTRIIGNFRIDSLRASNRLQKLSVVGPLHREALHTEIECDPKVWQQVEKLIPRQSSASRRHRRPQKVRNRFVSEQLLRRFREFLLAIRAGTNFAEVPVAVDSGGVAVRIIFDLHGVVADGRSGLGGDAWLEPFYRKRFSRFPVPISFGARRCTWRKGNGRAGKGRCSG